MSSPESAGFLARWSQRKALARQGGEASLPAEPERAAPVPAPASAPVVAEAVPPEPAPAPEPPPPQADVAQLTPAADFSRFVAQGVQPEVRNAALKTLFTDPHFNVMDGLDTYIDDYSQPSPLPAAMLRKMAQARFLGLVTEEPEVPPPAAALPGAPAPVPLPDEDPDLRLQPDHAAGRPGAGPGPGEEPRRES